MTTLRWLAAFQLVVLAVASARAEEVPGVRAGPWLGVGTPPAPGRRPFGGDAVLERLVRDGRLDPAPREGEGGWVRCGANGAEVRLPQGNGWAACSIESDLERAVLLRAAGHTWGLLDGAPFAGDIYRNGNTVVPLLLKKGTSLLLLRVQRGAFSFALEKVEPGIHLDRVDALLPDARAGEALEAWGAVVLANPTASPIQGIKLVAGGEGSDFERTETDVPPLPPLSTFKAPFRVRRPAREPEGPLSLPVAALAEGAESKTTFVVSYRKHPHETRVETFRSRIDGSVQYFAVKPPLRVEKGARHALVLSLHGASVEATGQADSYAPHDRCWVAAATNRRPFGFDWEDWGREDALEVLAHAKERLPIDPLRVHLAGHSMGGHGTWHLGVTFPDLFATINPSAGWISFVTYGGAAPPSSVDLRADVFRRATGPSDTLSLVPNLRDVGVFVIHGDKDDNVPPTEARRMVEELSTFHRDLRYHEEKGAGHWWDRGDTSGVDCVDFADAFDFRARHVRDEAPRSLTFRTWSPGVSSRNAWATVELQEKLFELASVDATFDAPARRAVVRTRNVARLALDFGRFPIDPGEVKLDLDGAEQALPFTGAPLRLERRGGAWRVAPPRDPSGRTPARYGPFKRAFDHGFRLVYGTRGTPAENEACLARARFDAQTWLYRGNGAAEVLPDTALVSARGGDPDRAVVLYGHRGMNLGFDLLLDNPVVSVERGRVRVGDRALAGDDLACLAALPRRGSEKAMVAIVGGTGERGMRLSLATPYFTSGVAYPDLVVLSPKAIAKGPEGVLAAGFLGPRWTLEGAEVFFASAPGSRPASSDD